MKYYKTIEEMPYEELAERIRTAMTAELEHEIMVMPYVGEVEADVTYYFEELTALCPMTGLPDYYTITIIFTPDHDLPELKALAYYFRSFRSLPIGHEHLFARIWNDFSEIVKPKKLKIKLDVAIRGGIRTTVEKEESFE